MGAHNFVQTPQSSCPDCDGYLDQIRALNATIVFARDVNEQKDSIIDAQRVTIQELQQAIHQIATEAKP